MGAENAGVAHRPRSREGPRLAAGSTDVFFLAPARRPSRAIRRLCVRVSEEGITQRELLGSAGRGVGPRPGARSPLLTFRSVAQQKIYSLGGEKCSNNEELTAFVTSGCLRGPLFPSNHLSQAPSLRVSRGAQIPEVAECTDVESREESTGPEYG